MIRIWNLMSLFMREISVFGGSGGSATNSYNIKNKLEYSKKQNLESALLHIISLMHIPLLIM